MNIVKHNSLFVAIPFQEEGLQAVYKNHPNFSFAAKEQMRKKRADFIYQIDATHNIYIVQNEQLLCYSPQGNLKKTIPLFKKPTSVITYNTKDKQHYFLTNESGKYQLQAFGKDGFLWQINESNATDKVSKFLNAKTKVHPLGEKLYISNEDHTEVLVLEATSGKVVDDIGLEYLGQTFVGPNTIKRIAYFPDKRRRGFVNYNIDSKQSQIVVGDKEMYGLLLYPFAMDSKSNIYVNILKSNANPSEIVQISDSCEKINAVSIDNVVIKDNACYISASHSNLLTITNIGTNNTIKCTIPDLHGGDAQLINLDEKNNFVIHAAESPGDIGKIYRVNQAGKIIEQKIAQKETLAAGFYTQATSSFIVHDDAITIPVIGKDSLYFFKLEI